MPVTVVSCRDTKVYFFLPFVFFCGAGPLETTLCSLDDAFEPALLPLTPSICLF